MPSEIVRFIQGDLTLNVALSPEENTVWLTLDQMADLFGSSRSTISYHVKNVFDENELDFSTSVKQFDRSGKMASRPPQYYDLDVIISVGYRVHSKNGVTFRKWATEILRDHMTKGYTLNKKRLVLLQKTVLIQDSLIGALSEEAGRDSSEVLGVIKSYEKALGILDGYDHETLNKPKAVVSKEVSYLS